MKVTGPGAYENAVISLENIFQRLTFKRSPKELGRETEIWTWWPTQSGAHDPAFFNSSHLLFTKYQSLAQKKKKFLWGLRV